MARRLPKGILKGFADFTDDTEIPSIFSLWVGISTISAALGRDSFIDMGHYTIYPNLYIVLVAGSAKCRKSTSIGVGRKFIESILPPITTLAQKMTPEALIGRLSGVGVKDQDLLIKQAEGLFVVDELSTLIDRNAFLNGMIPLLTRLYDCEDFTYDTKSRGIESVENPCLSIIGGSTIEWIKEHIPVAAIGGGFTARIIFVYKDSFDKLVPWPTLTKETIKIQQAIQHDLDEVRKIRGQFRLEIKAKDIYSEEYEKFIRNSELFEDTNLAGYAGRRATTLLKVAMVISAQFRDSRIIDDIDIKMAIKILNLVEKEMGRVLKAVRSEFVGDASEEVLSFIMNKGRVSRSMLVKKMTYKLSSQQLDIILNTLLEYENKKGDKIIVIEKEEKRTFYCYRK